MLSLKRSPLKYSINSTLSAKCHRYFSSCITVFGILIAWVFSFKKSNRKEERKIHGILISKFKDFFKFFYIYTIVALICIKHPFKQLMFSYKKQTKRNKASILMKPKICSSWFWNRIYKVRRNSIFIQIKCYKLC